MYNSEQYPVGIALSVQCKALNYSVLNNMDAKQVTKTMMFIVQYLRVEKIHERCTVLSNKGVNRAEISGPARKIFFRPGPQLIHYKICTMVNNLVLFGGGNKNS